MTLGYCAHCGGACELGPRTPPGPTRISTDELESARRSVRQGAYRLLLRCHRVHVLDEGAIAGGCARIGMTLEREDLE